MQLKWRVALLLAGLVTLASLVAPSVIAVTRADRVTIDGTYARALAVVLEDFAKIPDLTERQRRLDGYTIDFRSDRDQINIFLNPKRTSAERYKFGGDLENGRAIHYVATKKDYRIAKRLFFK